MENVDLEREFWQLKVGLAAWDFELPPCRDEDLQTDLRRKTLNVITGLHSFARIQRIEWVTLSNGDDAAELLPGDDVDLATIEEVFDRFVDTIEVVMDLDLRCTSTSGIDFVVKRGATIRVGISSDDPSDPDEATFFISLSLHADIYSPRTWGRVRDNQALAAINGRRLTNFLRFVREKMGGQLHEIDAPSYRGLAYEDGFVGTRVVGESAD